MNALLKTDIEPQMEKLRKVMNLLKILWCLSFLNRKEKCIYDGKPGQIELEKVQRYMRAYEYYEQKKVLEDRRLELASLKSKGQEVQRWLNENVTKRRRLMEEIEEYRSKTTDKI